MTSDAYERVTLRFLDRTPKAVKVIAPGRGTVWIPRSLLHAGDDIAIDTAERGDEVTWRVRAWFARDRLHPVAPEKAATVQGGGGKEKIA